MIAALGSHTLACDSHTLESSSASHSSYMVSNASCVRSCVSAEGSSGGDDEPGDHAALSIWAPLRGLGLRLHRGSRSAMVCGLSNLECTYEQPADNVDPYPF